MMAMLAPCTVTNAAPAACQFTVEVTLKLPTSVDQPSVRLPDRCPAVTTARLDPCTPCPTMHRTDVSDTHSVASHPVCPSRALPVYAMMPMLAPCTVTDAEPVPARLLRRAMLSPAMSVDQPSDTLAPRSPAVITTRRVPRAPCPTMHLIDVSDSHSVASHPVCPSRALPVYATSPMLAPCSVTDAEPVPARLLRRAMLSPAMSVDQPSDTLAPRSPAVITTRRVPRAPCPTMHLIDVSDRKTVASHPVCPSRALPVYATSPMLAPCTVTDAEPVPARLLRRAMLSPAMSVDQPSDTLAPRSPAVITTRRVP